MAGPIIIQHANSPQEHLDEAYSQRDNGQIWVKAENDDTSRIHSVALSGYHGLNEALTKRRHGGQGLSVNASIDVVNLLIDWLYCQPWKNLIINIDEMGPRANDCSAWLYALLDVAQTFGIWELERQIDDIFDNQVFIRQETLEQGIALLRSTINVSARGTIQNRCIGLIEAYAVQNDAANNVRDRRYRSVSMPQEGIDRIFPPTPQASNADTASNTSNPNVIEPGSDDEAEDMDVIILSDSDSGMDEPFDFN